MGARGSRNTGSGSSPGVPAPDVPRADLLKAPLVGAFLRRRHARTTLQLLMLGVAVLIILDGLFGPQLAPRNLAGILPWVHWRGFVVLALLVAGNLFCMACPFMLPRRLAKRLFPASRPVPPWLRGKWVAVGLLLLFFWGYEAFDLWASPWLTAWVAITYFVLAFTVDAFFRGAAFCKHLCPIGQFHFVNGMISPLEVKVRDPEVCTTCDTKDCIRGRYREDGSPGDPSGTPSSPPRSLPVLGSPGAALGLDGLVQRGCELSLYQPRKSGNVDCTFCLECVHACPHDNVGILLRSPVEEFRGDPVRSGVGRLTRRPDFAALALLLTFAAFLNAFGMVEPVYALQARMGAGIAALFGSAPESLVLALFFLLGLVAIPAGVLALTGWMSRTLGGAREPILRNVTTWGWALVPVGFGMWAAHYLYHLLIGGLTLIPVFHEYLTDLGLRTAGAPRWGMGAMVPESWLFPLEVLLLQGGLLLSLVAGYRIGLRTGGSKKAALRGFLPWGVLATLLAGAGIWLLLQPMEMRGTFQAL